MAFGEKQMLDVTRRTLSFLRLLCFEIIGQLCSKNYVWSQAVQHFNSQFWQQIHVFVMGINVLTNPYSQYLDFSDDSHPLFYEPYLVSIL